MAHKFIPKKVAPSGPAARGAYKRNSNAFGDEYRHTPAASQPPLSRGETMRFSAIMPLRGNIFSPQASKNRTKCATIHYSSIIIHHFEMLEGHHNGARASGRLPFVPSCLRVLVAIFIVGELKIHG